MLKEEGTWDIRCPGGLFELREKLSKLPNGKPRPYYWKVNVDTAKQIADILARAYHIRKCAVKVGGGKMLRGLNGCYVVPRRAGERPTIYIHSRPHMKTVFHEFYHHLDWATDGRYDSDDHRGGASSYGWQFADRVWNVLTAEYRPITHRSHVFTDSRGPYIVFNDKRLRPLGHHRLYHPGTYVWADFKRVPTTGDYTAAVRPWHLHQQDGPNRDETSEVWSSVQAQIAASKPPPAAKKVKAEKLTAGERRRRKRAQQLIAAGLPADPRDLGISCGENDCDRGAKFKYLDETWRCGAHHKRRVKTVKEYFKTEVSVTAERLKSLDALIERTDHLVNDLKSGDMAAEAGRVELDKLVKEYKKLGVDSEKMSSVSKRITNLMEKNMTTKTTKSAKTTKTTAPAKNGKAPAKPAAAKDWRAITVKDTAKVSILMECPYSGKRAKRWTYKNGMTVAKAIELGARPADVKYDIGHGRIAVK